MVGVDGYEWKVVIELLRQGNLPNLARLMQSGSFGELETIHPSLSPTVWASVATGMRPAQHGIRGFIKSGGKGQQLFTNRDRRTKALWNMASDSGRMAVAATPATSEPRNFLRVTFIASLRRRMRG